MKEIYFIFFLFMQSLAVSGQDDFGLLSKKNKICFSFKLINNLIFIPAKVNGAELTLLLDSGVSNTILFGGGSSSDLQFNNTEKVSLKGLGSDYVVPGLKSTDNVVEVRGMISKSHLLYVILGEEFNFSDHLGIPVNGVLGYSFFKNNLLEINYAKKRITIYEDTDRVRKKIERKFSKVPLTIVNNKPYLMAEFIRNNSSLPVKLLVDTGNSDSVWLFENDQIKIPNKNFEDYLGKGFSGDVIGRRAVMDEFRLLEYKFNEPIVAFPDSSSTQYMKLVPGRMGSLGGEILRRFSVVFDYKNNAMYIRPNKNFDDPFLYNKSGIEIIHAGMVLKNIENYQKPLLVKTGSIFNSSKENATTDLKYNFVLKPIYEIASVRINSPAEKCGLMKGDVIVSINKHSADGYSYQELNGILKSEEEKWITMVVNRSGQILQFKFKLINIL